jgi:hypothetical protein
VFVFVPKGKLAADDDAAARKRKELAERLRQGKPVNVTQSGEVVTSDDQKTRESTTLTAPEGKLAAGFYWYERDRQLYQDELAAMNKFFPHFSLDKCDDGRLCWIGALNPRGKDGGVWTVMAVYDNNHPHHNTYGGSVKIYSIKPDLNELLRETERLPHILRDEKGHLYMCTARMEDVNIGKDVTSAARSLGYATKWIWIVEGWLHGEQGEEVFAHTY